VERGNGMMVDAFYGGLVVRAERKGGRGFGVRCRMEGKMGKREGGPGHGRGGQLSGRHRPPAGGAVARQGRAAGNG
jgi:hypothetical protein